jgi:ribosome-binding protein aMBF1 (putative translation factor)
MVQVKSTKPDKGRNRKKKEGGSKRKTISHDELLKSLLEDEKVRTKYGDHTVRCEVALFVFTCRKGAGWTQTELAEKLGVSQSRVAQIENPDSVESITISQLEEIAEICGGKLEAFFELI